MEPIGCPETSVHNCVAGLSVEIIDRDAVEQRVNILLFPLHEGDVASTVIILNGRFVFLDNVFMSLFFSFY